MCKRPLTGLLEHKYAASAPSLDTVSVGDDGLVIDCMVSRTTIGNDSIEINLIFGLGSRLGFGLGLGLGSRLGFELGLGLGLG